MVFHVGSSSSSKGKTFYDFKAKNMQGEEVSMEKYRGKVVLVVNVASFCGLTDSNYSQLTEIFDRLHPQGLEILAFPCNQFLFQEPLGSKSIEQTCTRYKAGFDLFEKVQVNGFWAHPLYDWLKAALPGKQVNMVKWNFTKFLLDREGKPIKRFGPHDEPRTFEDQIQALL